MPSVARRRRRASCAPPSFIGARPLEAAFIRALLAASDGALLRACRRALTEAPACERVELAFRYGREHVELVHASARVLLAAPEGSREHAALSSLRTGALRTHLCFEAALRARLGAQLRVGYNTNTHTLVFERSRRLHAPRASSTRARSLTCRAPPARAH